MDENVPVEVGALLATHGASVSFVAKLLAPGAADTAIASAAVRDKLIVVTHDKDFGLRLSPQSALRPCVVLVRPGSRSAEDIVLAVRSSLARSLAREGPWIAVAWLREGREVEVRFRYVESPSEQKNG